jgi:hypothetical protein
MTIKYDSSLHRASPYFFWKQRIESTIEPLLNINNYSSTELVADLLIKLFISFLFGDGSSIKYSPDLDLVSTGLVMIKKNPNDWSASMPEPIVLIAGLNYLADCNSNSLLDYFAKQLFLPIGPTRLSAQERGNVMEFVIALRFIQGWWLEEPMQKYLPKWALDSSLDLLPLKPSGVMDCRTSEKNESDLNMFIQQLRNPKFPWIIFPSTKAGPDLRYSLFCCYIKTTWTPNSNSSNYIEIKDSKKNIGTMDPKGWYKSHKSVQEQCFEELKDQRFIHMRFELPRPAESMKASFKDEQLENGDCIICVDLDSDVAVDFFGANFVAKYREFDKKLLT